MTITHLDQFLKNVTDSKETKRALAVKMALLGMPYKFICHLIGVSKGFISKWKKQFNSFGIEALRLAYKGSAPYLTYEQQQEIVNHLQTKNSWQLSELVDYVREKYNVVFKSKESYYSLFRKAKIGWKKTQNTKNEPKKRPKKSRRKEERNSRYHRKFRIRN